MNLIKITSTPFTVLALALLLPITTVGAKAQTESGDASSGGSLSDFLSTFYTDGAGGGQIKTTWVKSIDVSAPAYCSKIKGDTTVTFKAPGMTTCRALCWQQPTADHPGAWGHDVDLAPDLKLDAKSQGSFVFHADQFPNGPQPSHLRQRQCS